MIQQFEEGQNGQLAQLNSLLNRLARYFLFTYDDYQSVGLTLWINGGLFHGAVIPDASITLAASATTYIEADATTGALFAVNAYTSGGSRLAIGQVVTNNQAITSWRQDFTV